MNGAASLFETLVLCLSLFGAATALSRMRLRHRGSVRLLESLGVDARLRRGGAEGELDGVRVRVTFFWQHENNQQHHHQGERAAWTRVEAYGATPALGFVRQGLAQGLLKSLGGQDIELGDPRFDDAVVVRGDASQALLLLSYETRHDIRHLVDGGGQIVDGVVRYEVLGHPGGALVGRPIIERATRLALALAPERATRERLLERVEADPCPRVRQRALLELWERGPRELLERAMVFASADPEEEVYGTAALIRGDRDLIRTLSPAVFVEAAARAPQRAGRSLGEAGHEAALLELLERGSAAAKLGAARGLHRAGTRAAVPLLRQIIDSVTAEADLKGAARSALMAIQARSQGTAGALSVVDAGPSAGAVSVSEPTGGLSLAPEGEAPRPRLR